MPEEPRCGRFRPTREVPEGGTWDWPATVGRSKRADQPEHDDPGKEQATQIQATRSARGAEGILPPDCPARAKACGQRIRSAADAAPEAKNVRPTVSAAPVSADDVRSATALL
jgi:hypothetical protein